jgi:hypothetical protein
MPGEFLTDAQEQEYGHFVGSPSNQQLSGYFHLDDADRELVNVRGGAHNKLGFALRLTCVRFLGTLLAEPTAVAFQRCRVCRGPNLASEASRVWPTTPHARPRGGNTPQRSVAFYGYSRLQ